MSLSRARALLSSPAAATIALGQLASFLVASNGASSSELAFLGVDIPTLQLTFNYALLAVWYGLRGGRGWWLGDRGGAGRPRVRVYALLAVVDVEANAAAISAFQLTSLSSVLLLGCAAIPFSMLLSVYALGHVYTRTHLLGAALCVAGLGVIVAVDSLRNPDAAAGASPVAGDALALAAAALYAISNVGQEAVYAAGAGTASGGGGVDAVAASGNGGVGENADSSDGDAISADSAADAGRESGDAQSEFLAATGAFGALLAVVQGLALGEGARAAAVARAAPDAPLLVCVFSLCTFFLYSVIARFLARADAAFLNLSLLSSDLWGVLFSLVVRGTLPLPLYWLALALVTAGLSLYATAPPPRRGGGHSTFTIFK